MNVSSDAVRCRTDIVDRRHAVTIADGEA